MILHETAREDSSKSAATLERRAQTSSAGKGWRNGFARFFAGAPATELVETHRYFPMNAEKVWECIVFYEEAMSPLPWLLRLAIPQPVGLDGPKSGVDALVQCLYRGGSLVKRITVMNRPHRLCFHVLDQCLGVEDGVRALDGYYEIEPQGDGCDIALATHYRTYMRPRWFWRPVEKLLITRLHQHILVHMRKQKSRVLERQEVEV